MLLSLAELLPQILMTKVQQMYQLYHQGLAHCGPTNNPTFSLSALDWLAMAFLKRSKSRYCAEKGFLKGALYFSEKVINPCLQKSGSLCSLKRRKMAYFCRITPPNYISNLVECFNDCAFPDTTSFSL